MRALALALILTVACGQAKVDNASKPLSVPGEKVYALHGRIVARDTADNSLTIDHKEIPGYMEAMTMDYLVRGAKVEALPPNGTIIDTKLHVTDEKGIWITNVKKSP
jgi:Copper binding periplasmic protein CusF